MHIRLYVNTRRTGQTYFTRFPCKKRVNSAYGMYEHDINLEENVSRTSAILDDVHHVEVVDLVIETFTFIFAGLFNTCLIAVEARRWRRTRSMNIPRILIVCLASIDAIGVFVGLLPKFLVLAVIPCPKILFSVVHSLTVTVYVFSILMSKMTVVLMGIERYASILMPFFYVRTFTPKLVLVAEIVCAVYAALFAAISSFFNYYHYHDTHIYYHNLHEHAHNCHEYFLIFEFGSINHKVDFPWRFAELCGTFQCYQLGQDILLIAIVVICNSAVMNGLSKMDRRMRQVCPGSGSETTGKRSAAPAPSFSGREFSRLMTLINVFVIVLTTPQMVVS